VRGGVARDGKVVAKLVENAKGSTIAEFIKKFVKTEDSHLYTEATPLWTLREDATSLFNCQYYTIFSEFKQAENLIFTGFIARFYKFFFNPKTTYCEKLQELLCVCNWGSKMDPRFPCVYGTFLHN